MPAKLFPNNGSRYLISVHRSRAPDGTASVQPLPGRRATDPRQTQDPLPQHVSPISSARANSPSRNAFRASSTSDLDFARGHNSHPPTTIVITRNTTGTSSLFCHMPNSRFIDRGLQELGSGPVPQLLIILNAHKTQFFN